MKYGFAGLQKTLSQGFNANNLSNNLAKLNSLLFNARVVDKAIARLSYYSSAYGLVF